jgi:hypothetical protein
MKNPAKKSSSSKKELPPNKSKKVKKVREDLINKKQSDQQELTHIWDEDICE